MMKKTLLTAALGVLGVCAAAQNTEQPIYDRLDSVVVSVSRAGKQTPVTFTNVGKEELGASSAMNSLPMALNLLPSVVTYNEGGTGLGNSAMTIRGSKGSQINVTLNGIALNDAESQEVFWVNIPALSSLISNVQVQRGLGTSANGAGAFGASLNMNTAFVGAEPSARMDFSGGSYNTFITTVSGSTGLSGKGFYGSAAYSSGTTDGYIRNAFVQSRSAFVALGWLRGSNSVRLTYLMGRQRSGITWDGIDLDQYYVDRRYNGAGEYYDELGNTYYYDNQTDNYAQHHLQLNYTHSFGEHLTWANTVNYTRGDGYDEYYKVNRKLANYGLGGAAQVSRSDMIYQKKMDNDLWVLNSSLRYRTSQLDVTGGVNLSHYRGGHWGEVLWAKVLGTDFDYSRADWYRNNAVKLDGSAFLRAEYQPAAWITAYLDVQYRGIRYSLVGPDDDWLEYGAVPEDRMDFQRTWDFFNPRAGVTARFGRNKVYASLALGHREPGRGDIKENIKGGDNPIRPEKMLDAELGWQFESPAFTASANLYLMEYWDMLLETGRLSSSGYAIKENVPRSWRRGIELAAAWEPVRWLRMDGNATLSMNRIADYTSYVTIDDYSGRTHPVSYGETTMLMSPSAIGMARLSLSPWKGIASNSLKTTTLTLDGKYVGKQFIDNTMRDQMAIPAYFVANLTLSHSFDWDGKSVGLSVYVNNLFNHLYYASGWRWEEYNEASGSITAGVGVYPQAPRNFCVKATLSF